MNQIIALGTFSFCLLISIGLYRYRAFITQIMIVGSMAIWLWSMAMMAYAMNHKHDLWSMFQTHVTKIFDTYLETVMTQNRETETTSL